MTEKDYLNIIKAIFDIEDEELAIDIAGKFYVILSAVDNKFPFSQEEWFGRCGFESIYRRKKV